MGDDSQELFRAQITSPSPLTAAPLFLVYTSLLCSTLSLGTGGYNYAERIRVTFALNIV
jgi:hypothetical protein